MNKNCPGFGQFFLPVVAGDSTISVSKQILMEFSKAQKIVLGIFTFLPFITFPFIFLEIFKFVINVIATSKGGEPEITDILISIASFIVPIILLALLSLALLIFYIVHAVSNKKVEPIEQLIWVLLFIFFGIISFPIYWLMRIWNTPNKA